MAAKILGERVPLHPRRRSGGGSLRKSIVLREASDLRTVPKMWITSGREEFVTASANSIGGAVTHLNALIPESCPAR
jgi:hypothetical protein